MLFLRERFSGHRLGHLAAPALAGLLRHGDASGLAFAARLLPFSAIPSRSAASICPKKKTSLQLFPTVAKFDEYLRFPLFDSGGTL